MSDIKIAVATHKDYEMPQDQIYLPIHSGAQLSNIELSFQKDNVGKNISKKNPNFCELTALFWIWKNVKADYKGLVHYRRQFSNKKFISLFSTGKFEDVLDYNHLNKLLNANDIIVPKLRNYYIETVGQHYVHTHYSQDLETTRQILKDFSPDYLKSFDKVLNKKSAHMFNMFIMNDIYFDQYCDWLFTILFELEDRLDISEYSAFHQRVFGRVSEILLDVWLDCNQYSYVEIPTMFMEKQNWIKKITHFLKSKILNQKY